jgi:CutC family
LSRDVVFEVCAEDLESCVAAREGGADCIELCCALIEGGLTPSHALISAAVAQSGLPIYTILRPRGGDFVYSDAEFALMQEDLEHARALGVSGFVAGVSSARWSRRRKSHAPFGRAGDASRSNLSSRVRCGSKSGACARRCDRNGLPAAAYLRRSAGCLHWSGETSASGGTS